MRGLPPERAVARFACCLLPALAYLTACCLAPEAVIEATQEAIYNSMFKATTTGNGHTVEALPIDRVIEILRKQQANK